MPPKKVIPRKPAETKSQSPAQEPAVQAPQQAQGRSAATRDAEARQKVLAAMHPEAASWLKDNLGLDVNNPRQVDTSTLYDIHQGKVTKPLDIVVTPLAYDRSAKKAVEMPKIKVNTSIRLAFPRKDGKWVPIGKEGRVGFTNIPPLPLLEKAEGFETPREAPKATVDGEKQKGPEFTESQLMALEGVGVSRDRLYGGLNAVSREEKEDMAAGRAFPVYGAVNTGVGLVRVSGEAKLSTDAEGKAVARFQSAYPEDITKSTVIDLETARHQEVFAKDSKTDKVVRTVVDLDFYRRDSKGKVITDVNNRPLLSTAGENLVNYGMAMEPVKGYVHFRSYDAKKKSWEDRREARDYQVTVVNGNLHFTEMRQVPDLNPDGTKATYKMKDGQTVELTHPEVYSSRVKDGKVYLDGNDSKPHDFASKQDEENFLRGKPAVVKGVTGHDYKANKDVVYDAVVVSDNRSAGFAKAFTPSTSKALMEKMKPKQATRRKQTFGLGL
jgi:hypothetical protein